MTAVKKHYICIGGPTASGKSSLAMRIAQELGGEIVCGDSVQIYRGFDIGSAKPTPDEMKLVPHHLFDICDWSQTYDAFSYARDARRVILEIASRGKTPIVVGGTGLYLRALMGDAFDSGPHDPVLRAELNLQTSAELMHELQETDPVRAAQIHEHDHFRLARAVEVARLGGGTGVSELWFPERLILCSPERAQLHSNIAQRVAIMLENGLIAEVESLLAQGCTREAKPMQSIGYKQVAAFLHGELSREELPSRILFATRQYAKRQCTWFKRWAPFAPELR